MVICSTLGSTKIGVYENQIKVKQIEKDGKISDILPLIFTKFNDKHIKNIYFARGPGSFMAIKLTYVFLKTISIVKDINLFGVDSFYFTNNRPIKSIGNSYFIKKQDKIELEVLKDVEDYEVHIPLKLNKSDFSLDISPLYIIPAVVI